MSASIHVAALEGQLYAVQQVIKSEPTAVNSKDEFLLDNGSDVNAADEAYWTPLHIAGNLAVTEKLLQLGATVNAQNEMGLTPFLHKKYFIRHYAASKNRIEIGTLLLERGADLNIRDQNNQTPLHRCAVCGYTVFVKLLLEKGARPNVADKVKNTPLHLACEEGYGDCALVLIENGGDITLENEQKQTPLDLCKKQLRDFILQQTSTEE
ncbi:21989_t:CDS:2 [Racocetra persica]|uniref:21989_t:CDS:1 n=1 Tax=Racocetra persica TaxID=160502 RepID=A0ACA9KU98_9GLOM|nr:21989_t:CDS:2 [Racocetra persica]